MNLLKRLRHLAEICPNPRGYGKTTTLLKAASEIGAVLIVRNQAEANRLKHNKYNVVVRSMDTNMEGLSGPFFFDNEAVKVLLTRAADKIEELEKGIKTRDLEPLNEGFDSTVDRFGYNIETDDNGISW